VSLDRSADAPSLDLSMEAVAAGGLVLCDDANAAPVPATPATARAASPVAVNLRIMSITPLRWLWLMRFHLYGLVD
jgi:hypothetical protein